MKEGSSYEFIENKKETKFDVLSKHDAFAIKSNSEEFVELFINLKNRFNRAPTQIFLDTSARPLHYLIKGIIENVEELKTGSTNSEFLKVVRPLSREEIAADDYLDGESFKYQHDKNADIFREALKQRVKEIINKHKPPYIFIDEYYSDGKSLQEINNILNELGIPKDAWVYFAFYGRNLEGAISEMTEEKKESLANIISFLGSGSLLDIRNNRLFYSGVKKSDLNGIDKKYSRRVDVNDFKDDEYIKRAIESFKEIAQDNGSREFSDILNEVKIAMQDQKVWSVQRVQLIDKLRIFIRNSIRKDMELLGRECADRYKKNKT